MSLSPKRKRSKWKYFLMGAGSILDLNPAGSGPPPLCRRTMAAERAARMRRYGTQPLPSCAGAGSRLASAEVIVGELHRRVAETLAEYTRRTGIATPPPPNRYLLFVPVARPAEGATANGSTHG